MGPSDVLAAAARLAGIARRTPVLTSASLDAAAGARVHFKCEPFQRVGAFKFRGAANAVLSLSAADAARGVLTHSSGNHGQALALAARLRGLPCTVVMPRDSARVKVDAVRAFGAEVVFCEPTSADRERVAAELLARTGATLIHPFDDARVIAGQGTAALELITDVPDLELVLTPIGGGGLLAGSALALLAAGSSAKAIGAEPQDADDAARSLREGRRVTGSARTIADGLRTACIGELNFAIIREYVPEILTVAEDEIVSAMHLVWQRLKVVIEPSSAVPVAALLRYKDRFAGRKVGVILTGGNVDSPA